MIELRTGDRRAAFDVTLNAYGAASSYVPLMWPDFDRLLDPQRNPLFAEGNGRLELFTAHRRGKPVGRIVAMMHDAANARHGTRQGQFGFFDCADEPEVAGALLSAAERWVSARGADEIAGNFNLTAVQTLGVVTSGYDANPYTDMLWNPPHIPRQLQRAGYVPRFAMFTYEADLTRSDPESFMGPRQRALFADVDLAWLPVTRQTFDVRIEEARQVLNAGFDRNPMFVPLSAQEYQFQAADMKMILDPRLSIVVHHQGTPVGVLICIPDLNPFVKACSGKLSLSSAWHFLRHRLRRDRAVIIYYSVDPRWQGRGLNRAMLGKVLSAAKRAGYRKIGVTWIGSTNTASLNQMQAIGAKPLHQLALYSKPLRADFHAGLAAS